MALFSMNSRPASNASHSLFFSWQLFKGKFFYCLGPDIKNITNKSDCLQANYKWVHHKYNFDNLGQVCVCECVCGVCVCWCVLCTSRFCSGGIQALMSLFVLASKDGWVNIMYHGLDAVGVDQQVPDALRIFFYGWNLHAGYMSLSFLLSRVSR